MRRAAYRDIEFNAQLSDTRILLHFGPDIFVLTADEAYRIADVLVDAAEKFTERVGGQA